MDKIDLTLRKEFTSNPTRRDQFDDTVQYNELLDYRDQRRSKFSILGYTLIPFLDIKFPSIKEHLAFFNDEEKFGGKEYQANEDILRITGITTKYLAMEYESGYGAENICDCCGGFKSDILNASRYGLCDSCEKHYKYRNDKFWERKDEFALEETWID